MGDLRIRAHTRIGLNIVVAEIWSTCPDCSDPITPGDLAVKLDFNSKRERSPWRCTICALIQVSRWFQVPVDGESLPPEMA